MAFDAVTYALLKKLTSNEINKILETEVKTATFAGTTAKNVLVTGATYEKAALDSSKVTASTVGLDVDSFTVTAKDATVK